MQSFSDVLALQAQVQSWKQAGLKVAFVPTMGNLHQGHLSLLQKAQACADKVVMSIFVNPLQFGEGEDFDKYPRTLEADIAAINTVGADALFLPTAEILYPNGLTQHTLIQVPESLTGILEGASRPGHFDGVSTVVYKLFACVQPDIAIFGRKDYQQLKVIEWMQRDLMLPIEIVAAPIVRDSDGLALSSRNQYLNTNQREIAPKLAVILNDVSLALSSGNQNFMALEQSATQALLAAGFDAVDYVTIRHSMTLCEARPQDSQLVVLATARLGATRLLDNIEVILS